MFLPSHGELVGHKYGRHFSRASVFSAINLFGSTLFLNICMHQQHFVQRIFYHFTLLLSYIESMLICLSIVLIENSSATYTWILLIACTNESQNIAGHSAEREDSAAPSSVFLSSSFRLRGTSTWVRRQCCTKREDSPATSSVFSLVALAIGFQLVTCNLLL
jgi:hypothetical protein